MDTWHLPWCHPHDHGDVCPKECADETTKEDSYLSMASGLNKIQQSYGDNIIIMGDFNARVGTNVGFEHTDEETLGPFGIHDDVRNNAIGALLREFCATNYFK